jgi:hypothetical protein
VQLWSTDVEDAVVGAAGLSDAPFASTLLTDAPRWTVELSDEIAA